MTINAMEMKQQLGEIIEILPESKLEIVLDFAMYLKEKGNTPRKVCTGGM